MAPVLKNRQLELVSFCGRTQPQKEILTLLSDAADVQTDENREFLTRNLFSEIWLLLIQEWKLLEETAQMIKPMDHERIQTMLAFIHMHYAEKISLDQIAASAYISKRECLRCFSSCIQKTPFEYLLSYRIQVSRQLLRTTTLPVTEIALQCGFGTSAYFTKVFRQHTGMTPTQLRRARL